jgi:hypothetical protein
MKSIKSLLTAAVFVALALWAAGVFGQEEYPGAVVFAQEKPGALSEDEQGALGATRTVNTAEVVYKSTYTKGYSVSLLVLGEGPAGSTPTETQAGLIASGLAQGKWHNYIYTYKPGAKDKDGHISTYTLVVRPAKWQKGLLSFFTDQSGVIRQTYENRAPTVKDPPLAW